MPDLEIALSTPTVASGDSVWIEVRVPMDWTLGAEVEDVQLDQMPSIEDRLGLVIGSHTTLARAGAFESDVNRDGTSLLLRREIAPDWLAIVADGIEEIALPLVFAPSQGGPFLDRGETVTLRIAQGARWEAGLTPGAPQPTNGVDWLVGPFPEDRARTQGGDDVAIGSSAPERLAGGSGDDTLAGLVGADTLHGNTGEDRLVLLGKARGMAFGGPGDDTLGSGINPDEAAAYDGHDLLCGGAGRDEIFAGGFSTLRGGGGADAIKGEGQGLRILGGPGPDDLDLFGLRWYEFLGSGARSAVRGGEGDDSIRAVGANARIWSGPGADEMFIHGGDVQIHAGQGDDVVRALNSNARIFGGPGQDRLAADGGSGASLAGGPGDDVLYCGATRSHYAGGAGRDTFVFAIGTATFVTVTDFDPAEDRLALTRDARLFEPRIPIAGPAAPYDFTDHEDGALMLTHRDVVHLVVFLGRTPEEMAEAVWLEPGSFV